MEKWKISWRLLLLPVLSAASVRVCGYLKKKKTGSFTFSPEPSIPLLDSVGECCYRDFFYYFQNIITCLIFPFFFFLKNFFWVYRKVLRPACIGYERYSHGNGMCRTTRMQMLPYHLHISSRKGKKKKKDSPVLKEKRPKKIFFFVFFIWGLVIVLRPELKQCKQKRSATWTAVHTQ